MKYQKRFTLTLVPLLCFCTLPTVSACIEIFLSRGLEDQIPVAAAELGLHPTELDTLQMMLNHPNHVDSLGGLQERHQGRMSEAISRDREKRTRIEAALARVIKKDRRPLPVNEEEILIVHPREQDSNSLTRVLSSSEIKGKPITLLASAQLPVRSLKLLYAASQIWFSYRGEVHQKNYLPRKLRVWGGLTDKSLGSAVATVIQNHIDANTSFTPLIQLDAKRIYAPRGEDYLEKLHRGINQSRVLIVGEPHFSYFISFDQSLTGLKNEHFDVVETRIHHEKWIEYHLVHKDSDNRFILRISGELNVGEQADF